VNSIKYFIATAALILVSSAVAQTKAANSITVVYKDNHQQTYTSAEVSRIDLKNDVLVVNRTGHDEQIPLGKVSRIDIHEAPADVANNRSHFIGKWEMGVDSGTQRSFRVTLDRDGQAHKTIGSDHGTWTFVDGNARITWDDGWRDVITQVGSKYEKRAFEPGKPLTGKPSNVTEARRANDQSI
jgi:hypothetical protein